MHVFTEMSWNSKSQSKPWNLFINKRNTKADQLLKYDPYVKYLFIDKHKKKISFYSLFKFFKINKFKKFIRINTALNI